MKQVEHDKQDRWLNDLAAPLPWRGDSEPTEEELERGFKGFAAFMGGGS